MHCLSGTMILGFRALPTRLSVIRFNTTYSVALMHSGDISLQQDWDGRGFEVQQTPSDSSVGSP